MVSCLMVLLTEVGPQLEDMELHDILKLHCHINPKHETKKMKHGKVLAKLGSFRFKASFGRNRLA